MTKEEKINEINKRFKVLKMFSNDSNYTGGYLEFYKNVIFETTLLDSDQPCPE